MDRGQALLPITSVVECCTCGCTCSVSSRETWMRSVKRKYDEFEEKAEFQVPGLDISHVARVGIENECNALREMVMDQQRVIEELSLELDEERNASEIAANETMSMILKLQSEKAEIQMEARQFKRFSEEKMAHDSEEISVLEDLLYKSEQAIESLTYEVQAYKHRMMSFGLMESEAEGLQGEDYVQLGSPTFIYPPIRCNDDLQAIENHEDVVDIEEYTLVENPHGQNHLKEIEYRINHLERTPHRNDVLEPDYPIDSVDEECKPSDASDQEDDTSDRVYTVDPIHHGASHDNVKESEVPETREKYVITPTRSSLHQADNGDTDVKKLYLRLQALEADRESLKQTILSMQTDKAQFVLLREIAQQLCKDMSTERRMPVAKQSVAVNSLYMTVLKWLLSIFMWRKKARQSKHMFQMSSNSVGLLGLLVPRTRHWRCVTRAQA